jgi:transglutaminase-like putative cysteine protease
MPCSQSARNRNLVMFPPTRVQRVKIGEGDAGIAQTIRWMRHFAQKGAADPQIRQLALYIVQDVPNKDSQGEINAIYSWVKQQIKFRGEYQETVQAPEVTLKFRAGDCDCISTLIAALLGSIGYKIEFKTVAVRGSRDYSHVYVRVMDPNTGRWTALDTTVPQATPGWEPPDVSRQKEWQGLGRIGDTAQDVASAINATSPLVNAIADVNVANFYRNGTSNSGSLNFQSFPGGFGVSGQSFSSVPTWAWVAGFVGIGAALAFSRRGK